MLTRRQFAQSCTAAASSRLAAGRDSRPNILMVYVDELRATALRFHNPDGLETPNLARLARRGVLFNQAFTPHPLCMPARVSLWTGQYTHTHTSRYNQRPMQDNCRPMTQVLRDAGYTLGIFGKNHCFTPAQLERWFQADYSEGSELWKRAIPPALAGRIREYRAWIREQGGGMMPPQPAPFPREVFGTHLTVQRAMEFIERRPQGPFAAWVSISDPHHPVQTPEPFASAMPASKLKLPPLKPGEMKTKNTRLRIYDYLIRGSELPESFLRQFLSIYSGMTAFIDHEVGRLLDLLERKGLAENTVVVFTSDHGDFAAEHHLVVKSGSLLDSLVRIPLIVSWPGKIRENHREDALVNHVDLMPTLLELCGLPAPPTVQGRRLPLKDSDERRRYIYSEYGNGDPAFTWEEARSIGPATRLGDYELKTKPQVDALAKREREGHLRMVRSHTHKLIVDSNGEREFYDLKKDPHELDNLHGRPGFENTEAELERALTGRLWH